MKIAIIPARGGSKRIPRKNVRLFVDKPMITYAIAVALESGLFAEVIVSTDDSEIGAIAREQGAKTPFERPQALADDHTPTAPVIAHAVRSCEEMGWPVTHASCIYPCVPYIEVAHLAGAFALIEASGVPYSLPVVEFPSAIQRALKRESDGRMAPFYPEYEMMRTQDLEPAFHDAGQFYWGTIAAWQGCSRIHSGGIGYKVPHWRVVDIDTVGDWTRAELMYRALQYQRGLTRT